MTEPKTFPPERPETPDQCLRGLWESMRRAGAELLSEGLLVPHESYWEVTLYFHGPLTPEEKRLAASYIRAYIHAVGWHIKKLRTQTRCVTISLSNA